VRAAAGAIEGAVERTPTRLSRTLSGIAGCEIWLKFENLQFTASFKDRGALNKLLSLTPRSASAASSPCRPAITPKAWPITPGGSAFPPPS
jgi:threonine dehydratase